MTEEKVRLLRAMGQSIKPEIIKDTLKFVFEGVCEKIEDYSKMNLELLLFRIMFECKIPFQVWRVVHQAVLVEI